MREWQAAAQPADAEESFLPAEPSPLLDQSPLDIRVEPAPPPPPNSSLTAPSPPEPDLPGPDHDDGARYVVLEDLLFGQGDAPPEPEALAAAVRDILDHPDMARVDSSAGIESWLAGILYDAAPRADSVLPLVVDHFHWDRNLGRWDNNRVIRRWRNAAPRSISSPRCSSPATSCTRPGATSPARRRG